VRSAQLTTPSNVDVKYEWRYTTTPPHQSCTNFPKIKEPYKNFNIRVVTESKSHTEGTIIRGLRKKIGDICDPVARDFFTPALQMSGIESSLCTEGPHLYCTERPLSNLRRKMLLYVLWQKTIGCDNKKAILLCQGIS